MKTNARKVLVTFFSTSLLGFALNPAHAGGVVGDFINNFAPGVGTALDQANAAAGRPFERGVAAVAESYFPGAGAALEAGWAAQYGQAPPARPSQQSQQYPANQPPYQGYPSSGPDRGRYGSSYSGRTYGQPPLSYPYGPQYSREGYSPQYSARRDAPYGSGGPRWRVPHDYPHNRYGYSR